MQIFIRMVIIYVTFSSLSLFAVEPNASQRAELTALVEQWIDAEVDSDREALSALLHKEFISTFSSGKTIDKEQYLDFIIALDIPSFTVTNEAMVIHGDTAVVIDVTSDGKTKFTWVAQKQHNKWQIIAQTFTAVKDAN